MSLGARVGGGGGRQQAPEGGAGGGGGGAAGEGAGKARGGGGRPARGVTLGRRRRRRERRRARPRRPDLDERRAWGPRRGAGGSAGQRRPPGPRRSGAERSWDTGGAAAAPDGTSALGPLVQAGASGEAFTGRFTLPFPLLWPRPRFAPRPPMVPVLPWRGPPPTLPPWSSFSQLSALLAPSAVRSPRVFSLYQPPPHPHPIPVLDPLFLLSFIRLLHLSLPPSQSQAPLVPTFSCHPTQPSILAPGC